MQLPVLRSLAAGLCLALAGCSTTPAPPATPPAPMWRIVVVKEPLAQYYVGPAMAALLNPMLKSYHEFLILENPQGEIVDELNAYCERVGDHGFQKQAEASLFGDPTSRLGIHDAISLPSDGKIALVSPDWADHALYIEPSEPDWGAETYLLGQDDALQRWRRGFELSRRINRMAVPYTDTARKGGEGRNSNSALVTLMLGMGLGDPLHDSFIRAAYGAGIEMLPGTPRLMPIVPVQPDSIGAAFGPAPKRATDPVLFRLLQAGQPGVGP
jgi:hypothetical protein